MAEVHLFGPQELYRHWEDGQWSPFAIDLDADSAQWESLMVAEERITTKFSGLVGAAAWT